MRTEKIIIDDKIYYIKIYLENRNNSRASIGKKGVNIRIPRFLNREEQFREILKFKGWAINKIKENPIQENKLKDYNNEDILKLNNDEYKLNINFKDKNSSSARVSGNNIILNISSSLSEEEKKEHISTLISRVVAKQKLDYIKEKIEKLNKDYFNVDIKNVFLKYNKSNWGSCSSKGNINISTRVLFAPEEILDYICVHELAHLKEHNHSSKFWDVVKEAMPDYKEKEKWLKENRDKCYF